MNGALTNPLCFPKSIQNSYLILIADPTTDQNKLCPDLTHSTSGLAESFQECIVLCVDGGTRNNIDIR